jgi:hypothetical protein
MKTQIFSKGAVVACLMASLYVTLKLLSIYIEVATGQLHGAGAAQWQFAFLMVPLPAALGIVALGIARLSRPSLPLVFTLPSAVAAVAPCVLFGLVVFHAY